MSAPYISLACFICHSLGSDVNRHQKVIDILAFGSLVVTFGIQ